MKWMNIIIKYRLWIGFALLALAIFVNIQTSFWPSFIIYFIAIILIVGHFLGPMRLIQTAMEEGDMEEAKRIVESIQFLVCSSNLYARFIIPSKATSPW
jgi:glucan phosphoethanolaminetransferase (alkaline phosphatase superfamily)